MASAAANIAAAAAAPGAAAAAGDDEAAAAPALDLSWTQVALSSELAPRFGHSLAVVPSASGPKVYAVGGQGSSGSALPAALLVQSLDPSLSSWSPVPLPKDPPSLSKHLARAAHASAVVDKTVITFGGVVGGKATNDLLCYDTAAGTWLVNPESVTGVPPTPRCNHTATAVGNTVYIIGGRSSLAESGKSATVFNDVWVLDWNKKTWHQAEQRGAAPPTLHSHSAVLLPPQQDCIVIFGGVQGAYATPSPSSSSDSAAPTAAEGETKKKGDEPVSNSLWVLEVDTPLVHSGASQTGSSGAGPKFTVAWSRGSLAQAPRPVVICGPSGVGKGTLISKLMADFPDLCGFSVSHTTRKPRPGEADGVHYHFSTRPDMEAEIAAGRFLEKADVHGNLYGTSVAAVQKVTNSGKMCILDIDVQGARQVKQSPHVSAIFIFVAPPSFQELERRLRGRGTETEEQIQKRLRNAKAELESGDDTSLFNHRIVNDDLEAAYTKLKGLLGLGKKEDNSFTGALKPRHLHASAATLGGHIVLHGGLDSTGKPLPTIQVISASGITGGAPGLTLGFSLASLVPPPPPLWSSFMSSLGLKSGVEQGDTDGDPSPARSSHQAITVGPSQVLFAGGRLQDGVSATANSTTLVLDGFS